MKKLLPVLFLMVWVLIESNAQAMDTIYLGNKGMELSQKDTVIRVDSANAKIVGPARVSYSYFPSWIDVGGTVFIDESPPDVILGPKYFDIGVMPYRGKTFLNMVTRKSGSYESVAQKLSKQLHSSKCYRFSVHLCTSKTFKAGAKEQQEPVLFKSPVVLRIWGFKDDAYSELLSESPPVTHQDWKKYTFELAPTQAINFLVLEAYYASGKPGNGNIQLDELSDIIETDCKKL